MKLMNILGSSSFKATDMSSTNWKKINSKLGMNDFNKGGGEEWEDEDAGWKRVPVSIEVPFSRTTEVPSLRLYHAADLYHCSIIAVLQEKLASIRDDKLFHYKPYQLRWTPPPTWMLKSPSMGIYTPLWLSTKLTVTYRIHQRN